jgi:hypothetical protein
MKWRASRKICKLAVNCRHFLGLICADDSGEALMLRHYLEGVKEPEAHETQVSTLVDDETKLQVGICIKHHHPHLLQTVRAASG